MTQKFTTPCFIRKNTAELRKKLEKLGYIHDKCNLIDVLCSGLSNAKDRVKELDKFQKATAEELIEHFKK